MPHVETVNRGPKVIRVVWTEQKAHKHTNTCVGQIAAEARESVQQRHANQGGSRTEVKRGLCELWLMVWTTYDVSESPETFICEINDPPSRKWSRDPRELRWMD